MADAQNARGLTYRTTYPKQERTDTPVLKSPLTHAKFSIRHCFEVVYCVTPETIGYLQTQRRHQKKIEMKNIELDTQSAPKNAPSTAEEGLPSSVDLASFLREMEKLRHEISRLRNDLHISRNEVLEGKERIKATQERRRPEITWRSRLDAKKEFFMSMIEFAVILMIVPVVLLVIGKAWQFTLGKYIIMLHKL